MSRPRSSLFVASFLMLFVELALIRGTTAADVYLSFFTNLVLLASFLGIGLGFLRARGDRDALRWAPLLLSGVLLFLLLFPVRIGRAVDRIPELLGLGSMHALPEWLSLSVDLPRCRRGDGRDRRAGRAVVRGVRPARRLPARRPREHRRDRRVLDVVVRRRGTAACGS